MFSGLPFAPRYNPVNGLMQEAVQLKFRFGIVFPRASVLVNDGRVSTLRASLPLFKMKSGVLKMLNASSLSSRLDDSHLGILNAFVTDVSKRYRGRLCPALRTRLPLKNWKSTGLPEKLSTGPLVLAPAGASNVVCRAQLARPAAWQAATPD